MQNNQKNIFLIGGTGRTGLLVAQGALSLGYKVTAVVRRQPKIEGTLSITANIIGDGSSANIYQYQEQEQQQFSKKDEIEVVGPHPNLKVIVVYFSPEILTPIMKNHDLVIAIVGAWPKSGVTLKDYSECAKAYIPAMQSNGIKRFFTVFGAGFLGPIEKIPQSWDDTDNKEMNAINQIRRDMRIVWDMIIEAELDYSIWCPANFPNGPRSDKYIQAENKFVGTEVTTGMVADSIINEISQNKFSKMRVGIARND